MTKLTVFCLALFFFVYICSQSSHVQGRLAEDFPPETVDTEDQKKKLISVLHDVMEDLRRRRMAILERMFSRLPGVCKRLRRRMKTIMCNVGDFCTVKRGARHGQLCRCPRGSRCSHFLLKSH